MQPLLDVQDAARILGVSPWTIRKWITQGRLKAVRLGRRVLLQPEELERFVAECKGEEGDNAN